MTTRFLSAPGRIGIGVLSLGALASMMVALPGAQDEEAVEFARPTRHFRVPNPAQLSGVEASSVYDRIRDDMVAAYRLSRNPIAERYYRWKR